MIGVVTVDDVIDAIVEEQTEDVQKLGAMQPLEEPYFQAGFWSLARKRGGWLILLFIEEMFTGTALRHYEATLASALALTFFIPLIISSGGNSGSQSATLITRALAVGDVEMRDALRVFMRELGQGLVLGAFLGAIGFGRALMWGNGPDVAWVVALTLLFVVITGTVVGAMLPLAFTTTRLRSGDRVVAIRGVARGRGGHHHLLQHRDPLARPTLRTRETGAFHSPAPVGTTNDAEMTGET